MLNVWRTLAEPTLEAAF